VRVVEVVADRVGDSVGIGERHELPCAGGEHVLRVPIRGRNDGAPRGEREGQRAGGDLLTACVRRHEDVRLGEQKRELVDGEEPIVEDDVGSEAERERPAIVYTVSGNRSTTVGSASITVSIPFPAEIRPKVERRKPLGARLEPSSPARDARVIRRAGAPCGTTRTFSSGQAPESTSSRSAVSVITITSSASMHSSVSTSAWCAVGSERTVCRVTTSGWASSRAKESTYSPSR